MASFSGLDVPLTSAFTGLRRSARRRQISPPSMPVAPTTKVMVPCPLSWRNRPSVASQIRYGTCFSTCSITERRYPFPNF